MEILHSLRLERVRAALAEAGADAALLTPGPDFYYLTGLSVYAGERLLALIVPREGEPVVVAPTMNRDQVSDLAGVPEVVTWSDAEGYGKAALDALRLALGGEPDHSANHDAHGSPGSSRSGQAPRAKRQAPLCLAADDEMRAAFLLDLQSVCPRARWLKAGEVMRGLRIAKDAAELELMARAASIADAAIPAAVAACQPGRSEEAVADAIRGVMAGPSVSVYGCIVASGPNSALPHHETGTRMLQAGDVVVLDYGCYREGYCSDITVTVSLGPPDAERQRVYRVVREAQQRALEAIRPGVPAEAVDRAARATIHAAGYGDAFLHRTGHGIGLQVHEPPYLVAGNTEPLEEGMCFSIEPGIYLAGRFGVRLEVIVTVTADGVRLLNAPSEKQLLVVGC